MGDKPADDREPDAPIGLRPVRFFSAAAWLVGPFLAGCTIVGPLFALLWLRARDRGQEDFAAVLVVAALVGLAVWLTWTLFWRLHESRGNRVCLVVPPRSLVPDEAGSPSASFPGLLATAPMRLERGQLILRDQGRDFALSGAIDRVMIGVWCGRWCCYAEFVRNGEVKRRQALGILPSAYRDTWVGARG